MRDKYIQTAESVTEGHPDKLCDTIADTVLDNCLEYDPSARVACEALATAGKILVAGEITAKVIPDIPAIVARTVQKAAMRLNMRLRSSPTTKVPTLRRLWGEIRLHPLSRGLVTRESCTAMPVWRRTSCFP